VILLVEQRPRIWGTRSRAYKFVTFGGDSRTNIEGVRLILVAVRVPMMAKTFDYEYELSEANKFRTLASAFERDDTQGLSERFSILCALCEEKYKILKELSTEGAYDGPKPHTKIIEWPSSTSQTNRESRR
jgi:hypothetical protein